MEINKHWYITQGQACQIYKTCTRCKQVKRRAHDFYSKGKCSQGSKGRANGLRTSTRCKLCDNKKKYVSRKFKKSLVEQYGHMCHYCWEVIEYNQLGIDHVVPVADGGSDELENLVLCCNACNVDKGALSYGEYWEKREAAKNNILI